MLRKALRIAATLALVGLGYAGYERGFAALVKVFNTRPVAAAIPPSNEPSNGQRAAGELALRAWGKDHWSLKGDVLRYYDPDRGFWMYAGSYEPIEGNKKVLLKPFGLLWRSKNDPALKSLCADEALVEFEKPMELGRSGAGSGHVIWARLTGNVLIRNDKATPSKVEDDLTIGPVSYLIFDEKTLKITSDQPIFVKDQNLRATGIGLVVSLLPKAPGLGGGFDPTAVRLLTDVRIDLDDVRGSGIVPGGSDGRPKAGLKPGQAPPKRPGVLTCLGPMDIFLPPNRRAPRVGPPAQKGPTRAEFRRKVEARQGGELPDQLNSDFLELTLVDTPKPAAPDSPPESIEDPAPKAAEPPSPPANPGGDGLGGLTLIAARATGHAVWLQSPAQGMRGLGNEMIYRRALPPLTPDEPKRPDVTYFRGDRKTEVEKTTLFAEGPDKGKVQSIDNIEAIDFTIYQFGPDIPPQIVSQGPGTLETRADKGRPIERTASWETRMEVQNVGEGESARRKITLTGRPRVTAPSQADITAVDTIVASLKPKAKSLKGADVLVDGQPRKADEAKQDGDAYQIEWAVARGDVHMISYSDPDKDAPANPKGPKRAKRPPTMNILDARDSLTATFVEAPAAEPEAKSQPEAEANPAAEPAKPADAEKPADPEKPDPEKPAEPEKAEPEPEPEPAKPPMIAKADKVWTRILLRPDDPGKKPTEKAGKDGKLKGDIEWARLRGAVTIHQDPAEGKKKGTDVAADKVDYENKGEDRALIKALGTTDRAAIANTDGFSISGPLIALDQSIDFAWVEGPGTLVQEEQAEEPRAAPKKVEVDDQVVDAVALLGIDEAAEPVDRPKSGKPKPEKAKSEGPKVEKGEKADEPKPVTPRGPMTVTWRKQMKFFGHTYGDAGDLGPAKAEFYEGVHAHDDQNDVHCDTMIAMLDGPVSFHRAAGKDDPRDPDRKTGEKQQAKINWVHCTGRAEKGPSKRGVRPHGVEVIQREFEPGTKKLASKRRILGDDVVFDKAEGTFDVEGDGVVWLYDPKKDDKKPSDGPKPGLAAPTPPRVVRPVADAPRPADESAPKAKAKEPAKKKKKAPPPVPTMDLTRIQFYRKMNGTFDGSGIGEKPDPAARKKPKGPSEAYFYGSVRVLHAPVVDEDSDLDPDALYLGKDEIRLACKVLRVQNIPSEDGDKAKDQRLMTAWDDVTVNESLRVIKGETLTYDSDKELYWVYGGPNRPATYADVAQAGVGGSSHPADAFTLNRKSGEHRAINPQGILLVDPGSGARYSPTAPDPRDDPKDKRKPFRVPSRVDKERRGFTGR